MRISACLDGSARSRNTYGPEDGEIRIAAPATTPGRVPASGSRVSGPVRVPWRRYRASALGSATTLKSRLVRVRAGLGTASRDSCTSNRNTAPGSADLMEILGPAFTGMASNIYTSVIVELQRPSAEAAAKLVPRRSKAA